MADAGDQGYVPSGSGSTPAAAAPNPPAIPNPQAINTIERFDGNQDPTAWLNNVYEIATLYGWSEAICLRVAKIRLKGAAQRWAQSRQFNSWVEFQQQLDHRFGETQEAAIIHLESCYQRRDESPRAFADRFRQDADRSGRVEDAALVYTFIQRLQPRLKTEAIRQQLRSIDKVVEYCNYWLGAQGQSGSENTPAEDRNTFPVRDDFPSPRNQAPPRRYEQRRFQPRPAPQRPPLRDASNRATPNNQPSANPKHSPQATASTAAVEDLSRQFQQLQLNLHDHQQMQQRMQDKDREIRTLRYALERQRPDAAQINFMGDECLMEDIEQEAAEHDLDPDLYASLMIKRTAEEEPCLRRMPAKRTAIDPNAQSPYAPPKPNYSAPRDKTPTAPPRGSTRPPYHRQPVNPSPRALENNPSGRTQRASPSPPNPAAVPTPPPRQLRAADLADQKARKLAADVCRSVKIDGESEGTLPPQAILTCLAGHLAGDPGLIQLGREMASRVEAVLSDIKRAYRPAPHTVLNMTSVTTALRPGAGWPKPPPAALMNKSKLPPGKKTSTCKVAGRINHMDAECVVDSGASTSAITLDCLRRMGLTDLLSPSKSSYLNADGRLTAAKGKVPNLILSLGDLATRFSPTVTTALNYDVLIGNDVLTRIDAILDYGKSTLTIKVDPEYQQELPMSTTRGSGDLSFLREENPRFPLRAPKLDSTSTSSTALPQPEPSTAKAEPPSPRTEPLTPEESFFFEQPEDTTALPTAVQDTTAPADTLNAVPTQGNHPSSDNSDPTPSSQIQATQVSSLKPDNMDTAEDDIETSESYVSASFSDLCSIHTRDNDSEEMDTDDSELVRPSHLPKMAEAFLSAYSDMDPATARVLASLDAIAAHFGHANMEDWMQKEPLEDDEMPDAPTAASDAVRAQPPSQVEQLCAWEELPDTLQDSPAAHTAHSPTPYTYIRRPSSRLITTGYPKPPPNDPNSCRSATTPQTLAHPEEIPDLVREIYFSKPYTPATYPWSTLVNLWSICRRHGLDVEMLLWIQHYPRTLTGLLNRCHTLKLDRTEPGGSTSFDLMDIPSPSDDYCEQNDLPGPPATIYTYTGMTPDEDPDEFCFWDDANEAETDEEELPQLVGESSEEEQEEDASDDDTKLPPLVDEGGSSDSEDYSDEEPDFESDPSLSEWDRSLQFLAHLALQEKTKNPPEEDPQEASNAAPAAAPQRACYNPPEDEACAFPDDGILADNRHLSLNGLVDAANLSDAEQQRLVSVLKENEDVFCFHPSQLSTSHIGAHVIDTGDAAPIKQNYYKMPFKKQEELKKHVDQWLELGIIRPSNSPWSAPMHLVPKKGGATRPVCDFRKLNSVTRKDAYPMPRMDDILYNIGPAKYISVIDLHQGYLQLPMAGLDGSDPHNSVEKTAFCCPWGLFEFTKARLV